MTAKNKAPKKSFWQRWIWPRIAELTIYDWTLWAAVILGLVVTLLPLITPFHLDSSIRVESLADAVISFAAIGLGISVALAALVVTFPFGRLRTVMQQPEKNGTRSKFRDLAFVAFWAGFANLMAATVALTVSIFAGPYPILLTAKVLPAVGSGLICAFTVYALLQMLNALVALLETAGLSESFER